MTKPSKGAAAFFICFGLMFLVPGLLSLFTFVANSHHSGTSGTVVGAAIALFISAIGAGFVLVAFGGYRKLKQQAAIEEANPSSPWLWRTDWASRRAESQNKKTEITAWVVCIVCNLVIIPVAVTLIPQLARRSDPRAFLIVGFCSIGVILFVVALRATLRHRRFGNTYFELDSLPFSPGGRLAGRIHLKLDADAAHGIDLRLSCVRKMITGSGDSRSTVQTVLWQTEQNVPSGAMGMDPFSRTIPVDFVIPSDAYVTDHDNSSDQVLWVLHAQADIPGINYSGDFELPVFKTSSSVELAPTDSSSEASSFAAGKSDDSNAVPVAAPAHPKVIISSQDGGTEFYFPAFRTPSRALFLLIFTVIWTGVVYFLFHSKAPWFFPVVFGLMDLFVVFGLFHVALGTARIRVGNGEIVSITRVLGVGSTKHFLFSEVDAIVGVTSGQQGGTQGNSMYAIRLRTKNGRRVTLADEISSRQEARWIASQIETLAGLKIDTHVEADSAYGPPPQPGQPVFSNSTPGFPGPGAMRVGWQQPRPQSRTATVISFAFFVLCVAGMFAWQGWRFSTFKAAASAARANKERANGSRLPAMAKAVPPRRTSAANMTDADAERVLALPSQDQAEELLERAIGHDQRALDLFEQQVEDWVGHIRLTDHMKQLERRSEFSSDLRVRYANADINLTLDGWQKNEQAAEMLIDRAHTDLHYRPAAVYFLGMLAGRGVAYNRIHPVLLDYAKHDPDPYVRQWAVEGMRYLGKDEALDELFESFTRDPSDNVRNRAGCNLSDCGNFTRAQRMRMAPKFIDLVADPNTNAQMRSWSYMALHEITDANIPADPEAWKNWYRDHGAEKLAEFERLEWWQVRGDE
ncbi:MAG TPA: HEAT repeat domain-containing protein [Candidatus Acidoferrum sp.]|nr:HEAT repeat domain-containing protein [Candidatus Acidoferrum sp.]